MKKFVRYLEYVFILIAIIAVIFLSLNRNRAEQSMDTVEFIADYNKFYELSKTVGISMDEMIDVLKKAGFSSIVVSEDKLTNLVDNEDFFCTDYYKLKRQYRWKDGMPATMLDYLSANGHEFTLVMETPDAVLYDRLVKTLAEKYGESSYHTFHFEENSFIVFDGYYYIKTVADDYSNIYMAKKEKYENIIYGMGVGFDKRKIEQVNAHGMKVTLQPKNYLFADSEKQLDYFFKTYDNGGNYTNSVVFSGRSALGYDLFTNHVMPKTAEELKKRGMHINIVEADNQLGFKRCFGNVSLAGQLDYDVVRCYVVPDYILKKYEYLGRLEGAKEVENSIYRAITDRNIRSVYLSPILRHKDWYRKDLDCYGIIIKNLSERLKQHHISVGEASVMKSPYYNKWLYLFVAYGMGALFFLLTRTWYRGAWELRLFLVMLLVLPVALLKRESLTIHIIAFGSAVFFPLVAAFFGLRYIKYLTLRLGIHPHRENSAGNDVRGKNHDEIGGRHAFNSASEKPRSELGFIKTFLYSASGFVLMFSITLIGAFFTASILSGKTYLLEFAHFRGVKLSLVLPALLSIVLYYMVLWHRGTADDLVKGLKRILLIDVKVYMIILLGFAGLVGLIYLLRSGNSGRISVSEELFRNYLENHFIARPRNKEFLIAFPAIFVTFYLAIKGHKKSLLPFLMVSMIGLSSVQNSFCHTRTPLRISFYRSVISAGMGIIIGFAVLVALHILFMIYQRIKMKSENLKTAPDTGFIGSEDVLSNHASLNSSTVMSDENLNDEQIDASTDHNRGDE